MPRTNVVLCFDIANFDEAYSHDHLVVEHTEAALARAGALPARVDFPSRTFSVTVTNPDLKVETLLNIFASNGLQARLKGEEE
jgi:hypothetical protein